MKPGDPDGERDWREMEKKTHIGKLRSIRLMLTHTHTHQPPQSRASDLSWPLVLGFSGASNDTATSSSVMSATADRLHHRAGRLAGWLAGWQAGWQASPGGACGARGV